MDGQSDVERHKRRLTRIIQANIGQQLRTMYTDVVDQGIPDRLAALIQRLDAESKLKAQTEGDA